MTYHKYFHFSGHLCKQHGHRSSIPVLFNEHDGMYGYSMGHQWHFLHLTPTHLVAFPLILIFNLWNNLWLTLDHSTLSTEIRDKVIGFFSYLAIFFFRLLSWQFIIIVIAEFSFIVIIAIFLINAVVLVKAQPGHFEVEKISSAILSLVLPMYKLPSTSTEHFISIKALTMLVFCGNMFLMISFGLIWVFRSHLTLPMQLGVEWFGFVFAIMLILFLFATIPSILIYMSVPERVER